MDASLLDFGPGEVWTDTVHKIVHTSTDNTTVFTQTILPAERTTIPGGYHSIHTGSAPKDLTTAH